MKTIGEPKPLMREDTTYAIKVFVLENNPNAIFLQHFDGALMGVCINKKGKNIAVYDLQRIIDIYKSINEGGFYLGLPQILKTIETYAINTKENDPIIIDYMENGTEEIEIIDEKGLTQMYNLMDNIKYKDIFCETKNTIER